MECTNQTVLARSHAIILLPGGSQFMCVAPAARSMAFTRESGHWGMGTAALRTPLVVGVRPSCSQIRLSNPIILRIPMRTLCHTRRSCMTPCLLVPLRECGLGI